MDINKYIKLSNKQIKINKKRIVSNSLYEEKLNKLAIKKRLLIIKKLTPYFLACGLSLAGTKLVSGGYPFYLDKKENFAYFNIKVNPDGNIEVKDKNYTDDNIPNGIIRYEDISYCEEENKYVCVNTFYQDSHLSSFDIKAAILDDKVKMLLDKLEKKRVITTLAPSNIKDQNYPKLYADIFEVNPYDTISTDESSLANMWSTSQFILYLYTSFWLIYFFKKQEKDDEILEEKIKSLKEEQEKTNLKLEKKLEKIDKKIDIL